MPHIVIVNAVYPPEPVVSAQMGRDLAVYLAQTDSRVTVLCPSPSRPSGANYFAFRVTDRPLRRVEDGVEVVRLPSYTAPESRLFPRMKESWSFGFEACRYLKRHLSDAHVVYANTWPIVSQSLIARHCVRRRIPLVSHIMDVYPESLIPKLPACVRKMTSASLFFLDRWIARQAVHTVVLSESVRRVYVNERHLPEQKVTTVPNWIDENRFKYMPNRAEACERYGLPKDLFTFLYLGNIGPVAGVEFLIESFQSARLPDAQLVIAGDGSAKASCIAQARRMDARSVHFISDPDAANVPLLQSLGHICLLPMRKEAGRSSVPSKLIAYLLSSKPVLATVDNDSDTARCIREARCGWVGEPENTEWLRTKMRDVTTYSPVLLDQTGERGKEYGLKHFSKSEGVRRLADLVLAAVKYYQASSESFLPLPRPDLLRKV